MIGNLEDKFVSAQCRNLLKDYNSILEQLISEIRTEMNGPINNKTCEGIALEYAERQGIKKGLTLLMQKISKKADVTE